jgi:hypothetical protein
MQRNHETSQEKFLTTNLIYIECSSKVLNHGNLIYIDCSLELLLILAAKEWHYNKAQKLVSHRYLLYFSLDFYILFYSDTFKT